MKHLRLAGYLIASMLFVMHCTSSSPTTVSNGGGTETDSKTFALSGTVVYADNQPAAGAAIYLVSSQDTAGLFAGLLPNTIPITRADSHGYYEIDSLDSGSYFIKAVQYRSDTLHTSLLPVSIKSMYGSLVKIPVIIMKPIGAIAGQLRDTVELKGVVTTVKLVFRGFVVSSVTADVSGAFMFNQLPCEIYELEFFISDSNRIIPNISVEVLSGDTVKVVANGLISIGQLLKNPAYLQDRATVQAMLVVNALNVTVEAVTKMQLMQNGDYRIVEINLPYAGVHSLTADVCTLSLMRSLNLQGNNISVLPATIGRLSNLITLNLESNQIAMLPIELQTLSNLETIRLSNNQLLSIPEGLRNLSKLSELSLSHNKITKIPAWIGSLTQLSKLYLENNVIDSLPDEIGLLSSLEILILHDNEINSLPESFCNLTMLKICDLHNNKISALPSKIFELDNVETLLLNSNGLMYCTDAIAGMDGLKYLSLEKNMLRELPRSLPAFKNLQTLDLDSNIIEVLPDNITSLTGLSLFTINANRLCHVTPTQRLWLTTNASGWNISQNCEIFTRDKFIFKSPDSAEIKFIGEKIYIDWIINTAAELPIPFKVYIEMSLNGGSDWTIISRDPITQGTSEFGHFPYIIPDSLNVYGTMISTISSHVTLRLVDYSLQAPMCLLYHEFSILRNPGSSISISSPNGGEIFSIGDTVNVAWTTRSTSVVIVACSLSVNNGSTWLPFGIDQQVTNQQLEWENIPIKIPATILDPIQGLPVSLISNTCRIKISAVPQTAGCPECNNDISDTVFTIH